jgi:hypothetical protein
VLHAVWLDYIRIYALISALFTAAFPRYCGHGRPKGFQGCFSSEEWNRGALFTCNGSDTFLDYCHSLATLLYFHLYSH